MDLPADQTQPLSPPTPNRWPIIIGLVSIVVIAAGTWLWFHRSLPSEGITGRTTPNLAGLDQPTRTNGQCFTGYRVLPAGRDAQGGQHAAVILTLKAKVGDDKTLAKTIGTQACEQEAKAIFASIKTKLGSTIPATNLVTFYESNGRLIQEE